MTQDANCPIKFEIMLEGSELPEPKDYCSVERNLIGKCFVRRDTYLVENTHVLMRSITAAKLSGDRGILFLNTGEYG